MRTSLRKRLTILLLLPISALIAAGCGDGSPYAIEELAAQGEGGGADTVTVYVLTEYELSEIVVAADEYTGWTELIEGEFDGSSPDRAKAVRRGEYIASIGKLRPDDPNKITVYLNGVYSSRFVSGCEYAAGYTLSFVGKGVRF